MIAVINYGMGNLTSVNNALRALNQESRIVADPDDLRDATHVILPGVGAFGRAMQNLGERGWLESLNEAVVKKRIPFLGICLGMQLLADESDEFGRHAGLGWIPGRVELIKPDTPDFLIPQIGWNDVSYYAESQLFRNIPDKTDFYFLHSFHYVPKSTDCVSTHCHYGRLIVASIERDNMFATQFHPEKSGKFGLSLLKNFCEIK